MENSSDKPRFNPVNPGQFEQYPTLLERRARLVKITSFITAEFLRYGAQLRRVDKEIKRFDALAEMCRTPCFLYEKSLNEKNRTL